MHIIHILLFLLPVLALGSFNIRLVLLIPRSNASKLLKSQNDSPVKEWLCNTVWTFAVTTVSSTLVLALTILCSRITIADLHRFNVWLLLFSFALFANSLITKVTANVDAETAQEKGMDTGDEDVWGQKSARAGFAIAAFLGICSVLSFLHMSATN